MTSLWAATLALLLLFPGTWAYAREGGPPPLAHQLGVARSQAKQGHTAAAVVTYQAIIAAHPQQPTAYNNLAVLYAAQGDLQSARQTLERALATNLRYQTVYNNLSRIYLAQARDAYDKALQLGKPVHRVVLAALALPAPPAVPGKQAVRANPQQVVQRSEAPSAGVPPVAHPGATRALARSLNALFNTVASVARQTGTPAITQVQTEAGAQGGATSLPIPASTMTSRPGVRPSRSHVAPIEVVPATSSGLLAKADMAAPDVVARVVMPASVPAPETAPPGANKPAPHAVPGTVGAVPPSSASAKSVSTAAVEVVPPAARTASHTTTSAVAPVSVPVVKTPAPALPVAANKVPRPTPAPVAVRTPVVAASPVTAHSARIQVAPVATDEDHRGTVSPVPGAAKTVLLAWARAWSAQDVTRYLSFYAADFVPDEGMSRAAWVAQRRQRVRRPTFIHVVLSDIRIEPIKAGRVRVELVQRYRSDYYRDRSRKAFVLVAQQGHWRIVKEQTLEVLAR